MSIQQSIYLLIIIFLKSINALGQDTTYIDKPSKYYSKNGDSVRFDFTRRLKGYPRVKYSRELIQYSKDSFKIENCYYYDDKRFTNYFSTEYTFINDSTIKINSDKWYFQKNSNSLYNVTKIDSGCIEKGTVSSLIPFTKEEDFITYNLKGKPLFIEKFGTGEYKIECIKRDLKDSIYFSVDQIAKFPEKYGDLERYIHERLRFPGIIRESAIDGTVYVRFVISSKGEVVNLGLSKGVDLLYDKEALRVVSCLPNFEPGKINGENVNMFYIISIKFCLD